MENKQELALGQLRTSVEQLGCSTNKYNDKTMMRFLIARSMDPNKAAKMFVQWHKWRESFVPSGFIADSEIPDELEAKKCFLQGLAKNGLPVAMIKACRHFPSKDQPQFKSYHLDPSFWRDTPLSFDELLGYFGSSTYMYRGGGDFGVGFVFVNVSISEFLVHMLDKTIASSFRGREIGDEKLIGILDLEKISYKNVDARGLITGFQFIQGYYPERLAKCFILNMPGFFLSVWKFVSRFLDKATLQKVVIVTNEDEMKEMLEEIGDEILPEEYGGRAKLVPIQDVVLAPVEDDQGGQINQ